MKTRHTLYKCVCKYETCRKGDMRRHLQSIGCFPEEDINELCIRRKNEDLSHLPSEIKEELWKEKSQQYELKRSILGGKDEKEFVYDTLDTMKRHANHLNYSSPKFTLEELMKILKANQNYKVETKIGNIEIPLLLTNGYFNSASVDRIDNTKGYTRENIRIIPYFLNVEDTQFSKINPTDWEEIISNREQERNSDEFDKILNNINGLKSKNFFYKLSCNAYHNSKRKGIDFEFNAHTDLLSFLIEKYIEQGGRCAYLGIPIYPETNHKYKASIERIDPTEGYTKDNIALIVSSLNGRPIGRYNNKNITDDERKIAVKAGALGFNIDKLNEWTLLTLERSQKLKEIREKESNILRLLIKCKPI